MSPRGGEEILIFWAHQLQHSPYETIKEDPSSISQHFLDTLVPSDMVEHSVWGQGTQRKPVFCFGFEIYCLSHRLEQDTGLPKAISLFTFTHFSGRISSFWQRLTLDCNSPTYACCLDEISGLCCYIQLTDWAGVLLAFWQAGLDWWSSRSLPLSNWDYRHEQPHLARKPV